MMNLSHWPPGVPRHLELPQTSLCYNLEVSATRYPDRTAIAYYGNEIDYAALRSQVDALAGFLQQRCGVGKGDRVALYLQNSPQFVIAFYAILRAGAVVVPVNTMNLLEEVRHIVADSGCRVAIAGQELAGNVLPLRGEPLEQVIMAAYSDYRAMETDLPVPEVVSAPRQEVEGTVAWHEALQAGLQPGRHEAGPDDLAVIPYTSGTTGVPRGCVHTHRSVMHTAVGCLEFCRMAKDQVVLASLPMFHVTGLQMAVNAVVYAGGTMVVMTRWDRRCAALLIDRHHVTAWTAIPTMLIDFLAQPDLDKVALGSLQMLNGGGAAMPRAVAEKIQQTWGLPYVEGYGLSETMAPTHTNPAHRPKAQCLGLPIQDTTAIVVDPDTLQALAPGEVGEILVQGPQLFQGYWQRPADTAAAFAEVDGLRFFRTGDLGRIDEDGYFFMVDRLKRMINASGFKVWPAEVEALLHAHPSVREACVIGYADPRRGESVKALVVLHTGQQLTEAELVDWAHGNMAAYKVPQRVDFVDALPRSATGKVQWRLLQEQETERQGVVAA